MEKRPWWGGTLFSLFDTPVWFTGWDLAINAISFIVALSIAAYSWRVYKVSGENKFGYFSFAFILVSLSLFFQTITQGLIYFESLRNVATTVVSPVMGLGSKGVNHSIFLWRAGFLLSMISMLGAWLLIFFISQKKRGRLKKYYEVSQIALFVYLIVLISFVSNFKYFVFYLTNLVILSMTVLNYYKNYLNTNRNHNALLVMLAFLALVFGNLAFVFVFLNSALYAVGEVLVLLGFLLLLSTYRNIIRR